MRLWQTRLILVGALAFWAGERTTVAQFPPPKPADPIQRIAPNVFGIGSIRVDIGKREVSAPGKVNSVAVLEFVACTRDGRKAYESALSIDAYAINFNAALLLIGLDTAHGHAPTFHFDKGVPQGDPVEVWVEGKVNGKPLRITADQLLFDREKNVAVPAGSKWVYTGSTFLHGNPTPRFMAEEDGVLIGFVHSPAPLIEQVVGSGVARYGAIILNPSLGLTPDMPVTLTVKAVDAKRSRRQEPARDGSPSR
jgi:hypothetical protein